MRSGRGRAQMRTAPAEDSARRESTALGRGWPGQSPRGRRGGCGERGAVVCPGALWGGRCTGSVLDLVEAVEFPAARSIRSCEIACRASLIRTVALTGDFLSQGEARSVPGEVPAGCWQGPLPDLHRAGQREAVPPEPTDWAPRVPSPWPQPAFWSWSDNNECQWRGVARKVGYDR